ncbi:hypothetical protein A2526_06435 [candidate division WOR-1 bacterium RIFOXYD2_FULL_36_8]|uniref:Flagellar hook-basal body complex protein FliE n=1 Tax=candidate division WOR-1 bacterium RIFOXYB2_FULL_36_35 TaxID=1802578 RepID=A0A1F4S7C4_UNCSA|nr:MAG: hypothetical protein A2230_01670 [candidate division WOR-1 bacterium RIFOXYA2_FULL_36_21]OGC15683.1 MAG: hypothetical protein A2282_04375 [candidate division WOR-1 bacterium RIFOXYA12_FULL_36_13]OGC16319.1 MAG: hypothetical protein A2290_04395 [candidate division WOR-1 bacterium RIFOXYB2_FULL_36_35]OGC41735.1 MAG: hypothetical protein A2526_06435 [candidate division WOR-1 bacterium RIFOXYD2_FULL_36_8]
MVEQINPLEIRLNKLLDDDFNVAQVLPDSAPYDGVALNSTTSKNIFDDVLAKAIDALQGVSQTEAHANQLMEKYARGEANLQEVMFAASEMGVMVQLATTIITSVVGTFKEITQMQV